MDADTEQEALLEFHTGVWGDGFRPSPRKDGWSLVRHYLRGPGINGNDGTKRIVVSLVTPDRSALRDERTSLEFRLEVFAARTVGKPDNFRACAAYVWNPEALTQNRTYGRKQYVGPGAPSRPSPNRRSGLRSLLP